MTSVGSYRMGAGRGDDDRLVATRSVRVYLTCWAGRRVRVGFSQNSDSFSRTGCGSERRRHQLQGLQIRGKPVSYRSN
jgi:hypothetical protein